MAENLIPVLPEDPNFKIIGLGGVGAILARYLCLFLSAPSHKRDSRVVLIDGDRYEPKNSSRMLFKDFGNKAETLRDELFEYLENSRVTIQAVPEYLTPTNIKRFIREGDIVFLAVDNHRTRKMLNEHVQTLKNVVVISAGNDPQGKDSNGKDLRGTYGNAQLYVRQNGEDVTNSLTRYHPEIDNPKDSLPTERSCTEMLTSVPQILFTNMQAAAIALQSFYRHISGGPVFGEVCFDIADGLMRPLPYPQPQRKVASKKAQKKDDVVLEDVPSNRKVVVIKKKAKKSKAKSR